MLKIVRTLLREDFGLLDPHLVARELMTESGVRTACPGPGEHRLSIEYDPAVLDGGRLLEVMCRHGVYPDDFLRADAQPPGDG